MQIDPAIMALLPILAASGAPDTGKTIAERRADVNLASDKAFELTGEPGPVVASVVDHEVPVAGGTVVVRLYYPSTERPAPAHLYIHGGSWWQGTIDGLYVDATCRERCAWAGCVVATVEYRLAPEFPFPTPLEDCYAALAWLFANADVLGIDATSVSIGGGSAGGGLAVGVAMLARDRGLPQLALQALESPALDLTGGHLLDIPELGGKAATAAIEAELAYFAPTLADRTNPLASPLLADSFAGLPPAVILMAECDFIRGDGEAYAAALEEAGIPLLTHTFQGQVHVSPALTKAVPAAAQWRAELIGMIRVAHGVRSMPDIAAHRLGMETANDPGSVAEPVAEVRDLTIAGPAGPIPARVYRSSDAPGAPVVVYFHGGGFAMGSPNSYDHFARRLANRGSMVLLSVDYRLAPEHPFPAGLDDCYAATVWAEANAASIGGRPGGVALIGDSAGGNLAAAVALMARDRGGPRIVHQVLAYPALDMREIDLRGTPPETRVNTGDMAWMLEMYLPRGLATLPADQVGYASPLQAADLGSLPAATILTAGWDYLRPGGVAYARRLADAGVAVELLDYPTMFHGFLSMVAHYPKAVGVTELVARRLTAAFD
jgi:acetyl esterase